MFKEFVRDLMMTDWNKFFREELERNLQRYKEARTAEDAHIEQMIESKLAEFAEVNQLVVPESWCKPELGTQC